MRMFRVGWLFLLITATAVPGAEEDRWKELNARVAVLYQAGKYEEAIVVASESLRVAEESYGSLSTNVTTSINNLATLFMAQGKYAEAEPLYKRSLAIREKLLGPDHSHVAILLNNLAELYRVEGKYAEAEPLYRRGLAIWEKTLGPNHVEVARSLNNLATLYSDQGKYVDAEPLFKRSLVILEKALGPDHPDVASALSNLAMLYKVQGKYVVAEPLCKRSLGIRERTLGPHHPDVAISLSILAMLYKAEGKYQEAEPLYKQSLAIRKKAFGPDHPDVATSLNNLAALYQEEGKYAEAEPLYKQSLAICEKTLGPDHVDVARSLNNLATLYREQGKDAKAESLYRRSLAIWEKSLGPYHPDVATSLNNLAALYADQGKYPEAEPLYKRSLAIWEKMFGPDHPGVGALLGNLAMLDYAQGRPITAEGFFQAHFQNLARQFEYYFSIMTESDRLAFLGTVSGSFPSYFSFCLANREQKPELIGRMYDAALWQKGFIAGSVAAMRARIAASGDQEALALLDQIAAKRTQAAKLLTTVPKDREQWSKDVKRIEQEANELERALVARSATLAEDKRLLRATWQEVRGALKPDEAAVEFLRFRFHDGKGWTQKYYYVALVVTPETKEAPRLVVLGEAEAVEGTPLKEYRRQIGLQEKADTGQAAFYEAVWKPVEPVLSGAKRVYVSTDGALNQVALGVAPIGGGRLLMDAYDLRPVSSTRDILRRAGAQPHKTAMLIGNPEFGVGEAAWRSAANSLRKQDTPGTGPGNGTGAPTPGELRGRSLRSLPGTQAEVNSIASLLRDRHWSVSVQSGAEALEEAVKAVNAPRVLHLATHGFFEADRDRTPRDSPGWRPSKMDDPMLRSGLFLTGANHVLSGQTTPAELDDGVLTAYEATGLNLQGTELVVLSACETGLGETRAGEGVFGLRRAFQTAGAEAVLMSMWAVPDEETQELMTLFYEGWVSGKEKHDALRQAQMEMRERVKARLGSDRPALWGGFVLVGR